MESIAKSVSRTHFGRWGTVVLLAVFAGLILFPATTPPLFFLSLFISIFMYVALAESWNIMGGYAGYISFAHVAFFSIGAYTTAVCMKLFGISPFITAIPGGILAALVAGVLGYPVLKLKGAYFAIGSILLTIIMQLVFLNWNFVGGSTGLWFTLLPVSIEANRVIFYETMLVLAVIVTFAARWIENSKFGLGLVTIREDEDVARTIGVNTAWIKMKGFVIGAFFAGVTGGIHGYYMSYIQPEITFSINISLLILLICFFGGCFTWTGPLLGAFLLTLVNQLISTFIGAEISRIIFGFLLIVVIIFMPDGIIEFVKARRS